MSTPLAAAGLLAARLCSSCRPPAWHCWTNGFPSAPWQAFLLLCACPSAYLGPCHLPFMHVTALSIIVHLWIKHATFSPICAVSDEDRVYLASLVHGAGADESGGAQRAQRARLAPLTLLRAMFCCVRVAALRSPACRRHAAPDHVSRGK